MRRSFMILSTLATVAAIAPALASGHVKDAANYKDGLKQSVQAVSPIFGAGTANPNKHIKRGYRNQRQYRKLWRQCPHTKKGK